MSAPSTSASKAALTQYLVCGLGSLGQYCVAALKEFGAQISAIDIALPSTWEVQNLPALLEDFVIGDCRQPAVLEQVKIQQYRAVLLVTNHQRINIEAAFAIRLLNPTIRLVVRSAEHNLNQLLDQQLGNFAALDIAALPAPALAIAALANETQGLITLGDQLLRVVHQSIDTTHHWCDRRLVYELNSRNRRVLYHSVATAYPTQLYGWEPEAHIQAGDQITYIEPIASWRTVRTASSMADTPKKNMRSRWPSISRQPFRVNLRQIPPQLWRQVAQQPSKRVAILVGMTVLTLMLLGTTLLKVANPQQSWLNTLYVSGVMLLGSYDTVFGALSPADGTPLWMRFLNLSYMLAGTASIAVLYALLTESLLATKFELSNKQPPVPKQGHIVLIGLGQVGRQIASYLQTLQHPLVGVSDTRLEPNLLPDMPLVIGDAHSALANVNLTTAKSVVVATDNEMMNLEIGLMAHAVNSEAALVIQTFEPDFSRNLDRLLPYAKVLCRYSLAAEAFAAAVFGDHILDLLRLGNQTVLVAEYEIQPQGSLQGLLLAEVAYGYGVVPILYQDHRQMPALLLPTDDIRLDAGDRLIVLATVNSVHQIDQGNPFPRRWQICIDAAATRSASFEGVRTITRITGCRPSTAVNVMNQLPAILPLPLYQHQALRLVRELSKVQTQAHMTPIPQPSDE
jgi:Trk K+ transport system NAD-binding subunit